MTKKTSLTPEDIEATVAGELYIFPRNQDAPFHDSTVTICMLRLKNGYDVIGKAGCVDPAKFDPEVGKKVARADALAQIWALEGYSLKTKLVQESAGTN